MKVGDSVIFKRRVRDYWTSKFYDAGWQGRIYKINNIGFTCENENNEFGYVIAYDSITLRCMPEEYIKAYLKKGADFRFFHASIQHFSLSNPRDTIEDMKAEWQILEQKYHYKEILEREDSNLYGGNIEDDDDDDDWDEDGTKMMMMNMVMMTHPVGFLKLNYGLNTR